MSVQNAVYWIEKLGLKPHPEGGFYREVHRSDKLVSRQSSPGLRSACTSIYYLLEAADYSGFHRIQSDELWYFHQGQPLNIHVIDEAGGYIVYELSDQPSGDLSVIVKAGLWFAADIPLKTGFTLVSCAVAPGFEFTEFEMAQKDALSALYPEHQQVIEQLSR